MLGLKNTLIPQMLVKWQGRKPGSPIRFMTISSDKFNRMLFEQSKLNNVFDTIQNTSFVIDLT